MEIENNDLDSVKDLLSKGADVTDVALQIAKEYGHDDIVDYLTSLITIEEESK